MNAEAVKRQLFAMADATYREFAASLIPNADHILGVRLPALRQLARQIAKGDWRSFLADAEQANHEYFEEIMLRGMVIGAVKTDLEEKLSLVAQFVPLIDNWSVCDSFCSGLKEVRTRRERVWDFLQPYLQSSEEYELRFGAVMLLNHFIVDEYIDRVLQTLNSIRHDGYYAKMAVAWAISVCFVHFPEKTLAYLKQKDWDDETYNKALQKIIESHRVDAETKAMIRGMKRKTKKQVR